MVEELSDMINFIVNDAPVMFALKTRALNGDCEFGCIRIAVNPIVELETWSPNGYPGPVDDQTAPPLILSWVNTVPRPPVHAMVVLLR